eukprot:gnl/Dysnectes_brevis/3778_a4857_994.p1 GENE.gnl/Dysnectes_brevis/3778_a4857_994~~gnl/Dysnectes_brevis/3778_a4857_994.p1  ORF type:complete len:1305 (-),score=189.53 gnl/Dysnectes_brevis/3778_a4857_994:33-3947(-)
MDSSIIDHEKDEIPPPVELSDSSSLLDESPDLVPPPTLPVAERAEEKEEVSSPSSLSSSGEEATPPLEVDDITIVKTVTPDQTEEVSPPSPQSLPMTQPFSSDHSALPVVVPSADVVGAALVIQRAYRSLKLHKQQHRKSMIDLVKNNPEHTKTTSKRQAVLKELLSSEAIYLFQLRILLTKISGTLKDHIPESDHEVIFGNVTGIYGLNVQILQALSTSSLRSGWIDTTCRNLLPLVPFLRLYSTFILSYRRGIKLIHKHLRRAPRLRAALSAVQESLPDQLPALWGSFCRAFCLGRSLPLPGRLDFSLGSLFLLPVQRVPRYRLFFRELLKYTPGNHLDLASLRRVSNSIGLIAAFINQRQTEFERSSREAEIRQLITNPNPHPSVPDLFFQRQSHQLLFEGTLLTESGMGITHTLAKGKGKRKTLKDDCHWLSFENPVWSLESTFKDDPSSVAAAADAEAGVPSHHEHEVTTREALDGIAVSYAFLFADLLVGAVRKPDGTGFHQTLQLPLSGLVLEPLGRPVPTPRAAAVPVPTVAGQSDAFVIPEGAIGAVTSPATATSTSTVASGPPPPTVQRYPVSLVHQLGRVVQHIQFYADDPQTQKTWHGHLQEAIRSCSTQHASGEHSLRIRTFHAAHSSLGSGLVPSSPSMPSAIPLDPDAVSKGHIRLTLKLPGLADHTCISFSNYLMIFGGMLEPNSKLSHPNNDIILYDRDRRMFRQARVVGDRPVWTSGHCACASGSGTGIHYGGRGEDGQLLGITQLAYPDRDGVVRWKVIEPPPPTVAADVDAADATSSDDVDVDVDVYEGPPPLEGATVTHMPALLPTPQTVLWGGKDEHGVFNHRAWRWDELDDRWVPIHTDVGGLPDRTSSPGRAFHAAVSHSSSLYIIGGLNGEHRADTTSDACSSILRIRMVSADSAVITPVTMAGRGASPVGRVHPAVVKVASSAIVMFGERGGKYLSDIWILNLDTDEHSLTWVEPLITAPARGDVDAHPITGHSTKVIDSSLVRVGAAAVLCGKRVLLIGGKASSGAAPSVQLLTALDATSGKRQKLFAELVEATRTRQEAALACRALETVDHAHARTRSMARQPSLDALANVVIKQMDQARDLLPIRFGVLPSPLETSLPPVTTMVAVKLKLLALARRSLTRRRKTPPDVGESPTSATPALPDEEQEEDKIKKSSQSSTVSISDDLPPLHLQRLHLSRREASRGAKKVSLVDPHRRRILSLWLSPGISWAEVQSDIAVLRQGRPKMVFVDDQGRKVLLSDINSWRVFNRLLFNGNKPDLYLEHGIFGSLFSCCCSSY